MIASYQVKAEFAALFILFTVQLLTFVQDISPLLGRTVMLTSLLIVLLICWYETPLTGVFALTILVSQLVLPITIAGTVPGFDSWFYIATAQAISANGWSATPAISLNASLFPGVQLFGIILAEVAHAPLVKIAQAYPIVIKSSVPIILIGAYKRWSSAGARIAALLLVSYSAFLTGFPFHHLTHGIVLLILGVALLWRWLETNRQRDLVTVSIVWFALLITHQSSTVYWGLLAMIAVTVAVLSLRIERIQLRNGVLILFAAGLTALTYYMWVTPEYVRLALRFQSSFTSATPEVPFIIRQRLIPVPRSAWVTPNGLGGTGEKNVVTVVLFASAAGVGLVALRRRLFEKELFSKPWIEFTAYTSMGVLALVRMVSVVGISHLGGTSRITVAAAPIGTIAMFTTICEEVDGASGLLRRGVAAIIILIVILNTVIMPAYMFNSDPAVRGEQPAYITEQWRSGYDWLRHGDSAVVGTKGNIYLRSMTETQPVSSYRPYAGDLSHTEAELIHYRDVYQQELLIRAVPWAFRIPEQQARKYDNQWNRVYSNGDSAVFYTNE